MRISDRNTIVGIVLMVVAIGVAAFAIVRQFSVRGGGPPRSIPREAESVLLITMDTTRADHLQSYGAEDVETPALTELAERGVLFERSYAVAPITLPSHTSMLTGLYPPRHGVRNNGIHHVADEVTTVAEILHDEGYRTAAFIAAAVLESRYGLNQGFEVYDDDLSEGGNRRPRMVPDRPAEFVVDAAIEWLNDLGSDEPFFGWVHLYDPHAVYSPPPPYRDRYRHNLYAGEIAYMDAEIGRLLEHPRLAPERQVAVLAVGDHGESLGEHGEETHALLAYDSTLWVPLIVRVPGGPCGLRTALPTTGADVAPTILDVLDLDVPRGLDGVSLLRVLEARPENRPLYAETYLPFYTYGWAKQKVVRQGGLKLIRGAWTELFDTNRDPRELTDLGERLTNDLHDLNTLLSSMESRWGDAERESSLALDQAAEAQLRSLGYLAVGSDRESRHAERPDPREMVDLHVGLERARRLSSDGFHEQAIGKLEEVLTRDPNNLAALLDLAVNLAQIHRVERAVEVAEKALRLDPEYARTYVLLAGLEAERERIDAALALLDKALQIDPLHIEAIIRKSGLLSHLGRRDELRSLLNQSLQRLPDQPNLNVAYARLVELPSGNVEEAERRLRQALDDGPFLPAAWKLLGDILESRGDEAGAVEMYREGLARRPDDGLLHGALGSLLVKLGEPEGARVHLREAVRLIDEFRSDWHVSLGALAAQAGRLDEARRHYELVLEREPRNPAARNNSAIALLRLGEAERAKRELRALIEEYPRFADAANNLSAIAVSEERWEDAERWAQRTLELDHESHEALNNLGVALDEQGRSEEARVAFERALSVRTDYRPAKVNLGIALIKLGRLQEGAEVLKQTLETRPSDPLVHLKLGDLYVGPLNNARRARDHYNAFLKAAPQHSRASQVRRVLATLGGGR